MTPADWETVFKTRYKVLDDEFKREIVMLAGEIQEMVGSGADPRDEEPQAFAQTILVLLHENQNESQ